MLDTNLFKAEILSAPRSIVMVKVQIQYHLLLLFCLGLDDTRYHHPTDLKAPLHGQSWLD
jgi:hypothetical protein